jgi:hypothetical protein
VAAAAAAGLGIGRGIGGNGESLGRLTTSGVVPTSGATGAARVRVSYLLDLV